MTVEGLEAMGLYLFLKEREDGLDENLSRILVRLEKRVYDTLSLDELARLPDLYAKRVNVFDREDRS